MSGKPFALSVKVIIYDQSRHILLLKRSMSSKGSPNRWEFPGGKAEPGEKFDEALLREVLEETGLTISLTHVAGAVEYELPTRMLAYIIMEGVLESGEVRLSNEHDDFAWVRLQELPARELVEQFRPFVQEYIKTRT